MLPGLAIVTVVMAPPPFASLDRTAGVSGAQVTTVATLSARWNADPFIRSSF